MAKNNKSSISKNSVKKTTIDNKKTEKIEKTPSVKIKAENILKDLNKVEEKLSLSILGHNELFEGDIIKFKDYYLGEERIFEVINITKTFITDSLTTSTLELEEIYK